MDTELRIGSVLFEYSPSHRRDPNLTEVERYRKSWKPRRIVKETRVSWLLDPWAESGRLAPDYCLIKLPKRDFRNGKLPTGWARNQEEIEQSLWVRENRRLLVQKLDRCSDYATLRAIEEILEKANR